MTDATTPPYEQWTVRELRDELRARSLPASGSQAELAARLTDADELADRLTETGREPEDLTVPELKDELRGRGEPVTGTKGELVDRLVATDNGEPVKDDTPKAEDTKAGKAPKDRRGECVVDDGTAHTGRATPGAQICSAHAMHYKADGTSRVEAVKAAESKAEDVNRDE